MHNTCGWTSIIRSRMSEVSCRRQALAWHGMLAHSTTIVTTAWQAQADHTCCLSTVCSVAVHHTQPHTLMPPSYINQPLAATGCATRLLTLLASVCVLFVAAVVGCGDPADVVLLLLGPDLPNSDPNSTWLNQLLSPEVDAVVATGIWLARLFDEPDAPVGVLLLVVGVVVAPCVAAASGVQSIHAAPVVDTQAAAKCGCHTGVGVLRTHGFVCCWPQASHRPSCCCAKKCCQLLSYLGRKRTEWQPGRRCRPACNSTNQCRPRPARVACSPPGSVPQRCRRSRRPCCMRMRWPDRPQPLLCCRVLHPW